MQVFLPVADFQASLAMLDGPRLRKQRVEAFQLINVVFNRTERKGWRNHPAAVMFRQYGPALQRYYNLSLAENAKRGGNNIKLQPEQIDSGIQLPHWLGDESVHSSHRSRLLFKGKMDVLADRIRRHTATRSVNKWLHQLGLPTLNECRQSDYVAISSMLDEMGAAQSSLSNHYSQFGWTESDINEYVWPGESPGDPNRRIR
jgi:hypothetical protein